jgi:hypothetical protein
VCVCHSYNEQISNQTMAETTIEQLNKRARGLLVSISCPAYVLRDPKRGPDRRRLLRWLYLNFRSVPDNGEAATKVSMETLKMWVENMGVPGLDVESAHRSAAVPESSESPETALKIENDCLLLIRLIETVAASSMPGNAESDLDLMSLITSNYDSVFSKECNLFPMDLEHVVNMKESLINDKGQYLAEDTEGLETMAHELRAENVQLKYTIQEKINEGFEKQPSTTELEKMGSLASSKLTNACDRLVNATDRFNRFARTMLEKSLTSQDNVVHEPSDYPDFSAIGKGAADTNKEMQQVIRTLQLLKDSRESFECLAYQGMENSAPNVVSP